MRFGCQLPCLTESPQAAEVTAALDPVSLSLTAGAAPGSAGLPLPAGLASLSSRTRTRDGTPRSPDRSSRGSIPREFSGMQLDEVVHADRLLACELEQVVGHTVIAALLVQLRHDGEVLDDVRRHARS